MKKRIAFLFLLTLSSLVAYGQSTITPYHQRNDFLMTTPGALKFGLYGYDNPALLSYVRQPDVLFTWSDRTAPWDEFKRWGLFMGFPNFGFGTIHEQTPAGNSAEYALSFAGGNRFISSGLSYNWTRASTAILDKSSLLTSGVLIRPCPRNSFGVTWTQAINTSGY